MAWGCVDHLKVYQGHPVMNLIREGALLGSGGGESLAITFLSLSFLICQLGSQEQMPRASPQWLYI